MKINNTKSLRVKSIKFSMRSAVLFFYTLFVFPLYSGAYIQCEKGKCYFPSDQLVKNQVKSGKKFDSEGFVRLKSPDNTYSISFPKHWTTTFQGKEQFLSSISSDDEENDLFNENALIGSFPIDPGYSLWDFYKGNLDQLSLNVRELEIVSSEVFQLDGVEAVKVIYSSQMDGEHYTTTQVFALHGDLAYVLTFISEKEKFSYYKSTFNQIIKSFNIADGF